MKPSEMEDWYRYCHYAFGLDQDFEDWDKNRRRRNLNPDTMVPYGYFVDDVLVSTCGYIPFRVRLRGQIVNMGGISFVTTPPEYRRRGYVADMLKRLVAELNALDMPVSGLWPFSRAFYRRYGWATCVDSSEIELETEQLRSLVRGFRSTASFARATLDDAPRMDEVHRRWSVPYDLCVIRDREGWRTQTFSGWKKDPHVYVAKGSDDEVIAYLAYTVDEREDWDRDLRVTDLAFRDADAYREILYFLANHDSQVNRFHLSTPNSDPLFDWMVGGKVARACGIMVRISDPGLVLEGISIPEGAEGSVVLGIEDDFLPGNSGDYRIDFSAGQVEVRVVDEPVDVQLDVAALSQLVSGYRSLEELQRFGRAQVFSRGAVLDSLLPRSHTFMREHF